jgi:hypothetical protein
MNLETYKINIRAYFPDVMFLESGSRVECLSTDGDWLHTLYWEDGVAYFAISDTELTEKSLMKYLKHVSETHKQYDASKLALPIDTYEDRSIELMHTLCDMYRKEAGK